MVLISSGIVRRRVQRRIMRTVPCPYMRWWRTFSVRRQRRIASIVRRIVASRSAIRIGLVTVVRIVGRRSWFSWWAVVH
jgi:hypothetical protein